MECAFHPYFKGVESMLEARVGIEGRPPSALLLRAQFQPDNTELEDAWQDRPASALPTPFQRSLTEEFTEGKRMFRKVPCETGLEQSLNRGHFASNDSIEYGHKKSAGVSSIYYSRRETSAVEVRSRAAETGGEIRRVCFKPAYFDPDYTLPT
jgi:hypothetical protein